MPDEAGMATGIEDDDAAETERLMLPEEVAEILGVKASWVYYAARRGIVPCVHAGRYVRFRRSVLMDWIDRGGRSDDDV